jgi:hypothetical protein
MASSIADLNRSDGRSNRNTALSTGTCSGYIDIDVPFAMIIVDIDDDDRRRPCMAL